MKNYYKRLFISTALLLVGGFGCIGIHAQESEAPRYHAEVFRVDASDIEGEIDALEKEGVIVLNHRDDIVIAFIPYVMQEESEAAESSEAANKIKRWKKGISQRNVGKKIGDKPYTKRNIPTMDVARTMNDADKIQSGSSLTQAFTGKGVVVGFCDVGFDARHINFLDYTGAVSRVKLAVQYRESQGERIVYDTPEAIYEWQTDDEDNMHATHVCGIMAGAYGFREGTCPYYGMAPEADIVATTSELSDAAILSGVEDIIAYAKSVGKPAVINISLGSYSGAHDGTSLVCQYLDKCAEDAIICISAGNEGSNRNHCVKTMTSDNDYIRVRFEGTDWVYKRMNGLTDFYADDARPMNITLAFLDSTKSGWNPYHTTSKISFDDISDYVITSYPEDEEIDPAYHYDEEFAKYFEGRVYVFGEVDPENGRYHLQIYYDTYTDIDYAENKVWARYRLGAVVSGSAGQRIDAFADGATSRLSKEPGVSPAPDTSFSVSDLATGYNTICVGMYDTQGDITTFNGGSWGGSSAYTVHSYSGYATLLDGRVMPELVAPGGPIVSSYSTPYMLKYGYGNASYKTTPQYASQNASQSADQSEASFVVKSSARSATQLYDSEQEYYWLPYTGTSMSTPYAAGVIATWLQANPDLTSKEAKEIIEATNETDVHTLASNPRHGRGYMMPYLGLIEALKGSSVKVSEVIAETIFLRAEGGDIVIENPEMQELQMAVYGTDGSVRVIEKLGDAVYYRIPKTELSGIQKGVNIVKITGKDSKYLKILI